MSLLDDLISYWPLDESSGNALDAHGSNDLTDNNTVGTATGLIAGARDFVPANSESLTHASNASLTTGEIDWTIGLWVYLDSKASSRPLVSRWSNTSSDREYLLFYQSSGDRFRWVVQGASSVASVNADQLGSPSTGTWYYVLAWHAAGDNEIGIQVNNGTADTASGPTGSVPESTQNFRLGYDPDIGAYHDGRIDEAAFWKRLLTDAEKTRLYNSGSGLDYGSFGSPWYYYAQQQVAS